MGFLEDLFGNLGSDITGSAPGARTFPLQGGARSQSEAIQRLLGGGGFQQLLQSLGRGREGGVEGLFRSEASQAGFDSPLGFAGLGSIDDIMASINKAGVSAGRTAFESTGGGLDISDAMRARTGNISGGQGGNILAQRFNADVAAPVAMRAASLAPQLQQQGLDRRMSLLGMLGDARTADTNSTRQFYSTLIGNRSPERAIVPDSGVQGLLSQLLGGSLSGSSGGSNFLDQLIKGAGGGTGGLG